jgi:hypothetical protein
MIRLTTLFISLMLLTSCASLDLRNLGKTTVSTGTAYLLGGPIAGVTVGLTAMAYDELVPDSPEVADIETKEQAVAYVAEEWGKDILYGFLAFLLITNIAVPWLTKRRGYNQAKQKYKSTVDK